jgi:hypothetical protein
VKSCLDRYNQQANAALNDRNAHHRYLNFICSVYGSGIGSERAYAMLTRASTKWHTKELLQVFSTVQIYDPATLMAHAGDSGGTGNNTESWRPSNFVSMLALRVRLRLCFTTWQERGQLLVMGRAATKTARKDWKPGAERPDTSVDRVSRMGACPTGRL